MRTCHVFVQISHLLRLAQSDSVDDRCVVELVTQDSVIRSQKNLENTCICIETTRVQNRVVTTVEASDLFL